MKKELHDDDAIAVEIALEAPDALETLVPEVFGYKRGRNLLFSEELGMDTNDECFFVITAIEDANVAPIGQALHGTPEIVVIELLGRRRFEGINLTSLRIHARHNVLDRAIF